MLNFDCATVNTVLRIFKIIATIGFLTALECPEFVFGQGSVPDPTGGAYSAPPDPLAGLGGRTFKGEERGDRDKGERKGTGGTGPFFANSWTARALLLLQYQYYFPGRYLWQCGNHNLKSHKRCNNMSRMNLYV